MLSKFPVKPLAITVGLMAADGFVASHDITAYAKANPTAPAGTSPPLLKSKALWLQGGAVALGLLGEMTGFHPDYTETLMTVGTGLMAREAAVHFAQGRQTTPASVQGYRAHVSAPAWEPVPAALARPLARADTNLSGVGSRQGTTLAG